MGKAGNGPTLGERAARAKARAAAKAARESGSRVAHCWVLDGSQHVPGLVIEWRKNSDANTWEARTVYATLHTGRLAVVDVWLPQTLLMPANN
jgi:hypothetical protein